MPKVRLGVIGAGNIGKTHIGHITEGRVPELEVTAAADRLAENREWVSARCPDAAVYAEGLELIAGGGCDAVLVAVPHIQHPALSIAAFRAGLHVLCEKPAGVDCGQARGMNQEAAKNPGLAFGMMFNQRTNPVYIKMRELARSGELGALKRVNWIITDWYRPQFYYDSGGWRATWDGEGGGVLLNQCPHNLDLLQWICGMPQDVRAFCHEGRWHDIEVEDDVTAYMEWAPREENRRGATGVFVTSTADAPGTNRFELTLEGGKVVCEDGKLTLWRLEENERVFCKRARSLWAAPSYTVEEVAADGENPQHAGVLNAFAAHILRGEALVAHGSEGLNSLIISNGCHLSSWLGKTVRLPADEELFLRMLDQKRHS